MNNLAAIYRAALIAQAADREAEQRIAFRLRYQVYCLERGYEDPASFPDGLERDAHDAHARHVLVRNRTGGAPLGASRLILDHGRPGSLPVESHGSGSTRRYLGQVREAPDARLAEVSRLAVTREFRQMARRGACDAHSWRRLADGERRPPQSEALGPVSFSAQHVSMGLIALLFQQSWQEGVTHWTALLGSSLLRSLARLGIHFHPVGAVVEHRGVRQPVLGRLCDLWAGVNEQSPELAALARELGVPEDADWTGRPCEVPQRASGCPDF